MATEIKIINTTRYNGYFELSIEVKCAIPSNLNVLDNKQEIARSYSSIYPISRIENGYIYFIPKTISLSDGTTNEQIEAIFNGIIQEYDYVLGNFQLQDLDDLIGKTYNGTNWSYIL